MNVAKQLDTLVRFYCPGCKPHPQTWPAHWVRARRFVFGS